MVIMAAIWVYTQNFVFAGIACAITMVVSIVMLFERTISVSMGIPIIAGCITIPVSWATILRRA